MNNLKSKNKSRKRKSIYFILFPILLFIFFIYLYLDRENYLSCIKNDFQLCLHSKKYISQNGKFTFRYPVDYPLSAMNSNQMRKRYQSDFNTDEWVNFSDYFYPNAGGERLGSITVASSSGFTTVEEVIDKERNSYLESSIIEYVVIDGKKAGCYSFSHQQNIFSSPSYGCYILNNNNLYQIEFNYNDYYHLKPVRYYEQANTLILSTFKIK